MEDVLEALEAATAHDAVSLDAPLGSMDDGSRATYADTVRSTGCARWRTASPANRAGGSA